MVVWKPDKNVCFMVLIVQYLNSLPNHVIRPFENRTKVSEKSKARISGNEYSDGYCGTIYKQMLPNVPGSRSLAESWNRNKPCLDQFCHIASHNDVDKDKICPT